MKNIDSLREECQEVMDELRTGKLKHYTASEWINGFGKQISSAKMQLEGAALSKEGPCKSARKFLCMDEK